MWDRVDDWNVLQRGHADSSTGQAVLRTCYSVLRAATPYIGQYLLHSTHNPSAQARQSRELEAAEHIIVSRQGQYGESTEYGVLMG